MTEHLNHVKWAGWGVVDVETLDRQQRRNYLKKVREELAVIGCVLHPGGTTQKPWYKAAGPGTDAKGGEKVPRVQIVSGTNAFQKICAAVLTELGETQGETQGETHAGTIEVETLRK